MALKPWEVSLIVIGGLIGLYVLFRKVNSGLERPTDISRGKNDTNSYLWDKSTLNKTTSRNNPEYDIHTLGKEFGYASIWGGKRKRKRRRKPRR